MKVALAQRRVFACGAVSLGLHASAAAAIFLGFGQAVARPPSAAMVVEMASLPSAPPAPPNLAPPTPQRQEATPKPVIDKLKIPPLPKLALDIKPEVAVPIKPPEEQKRKPDPNQKPDDVTTPQSAPQAPNKDAPKAPSFGDPVQSATAEQNWYSKVLAALERKKRYPGEAQRSGQEDVVYVKIFVDRSGRVMQSRISKSHGFGLLDDEVMSLVRRASPLPAPPKEVTGQTIDLLVPVEFFLKRQTASR
ncbi:energy transducer TonB [Sphingomonas sp.]|uniref:energy transducer TonB n=1 Tax=Sphingomonas sp. TaxID=28214 RepID=UPI0025EC63C0|nr:energy transducer TonB [Sphingomonas sp.]